MVLNIFLMILGIVLLILSSNKFVEAASNLAISFKVPKMVIALTIAAFCTCTPELAISFNSIMGGNYDITLANVVGSCIVNILLIIGIASIVKPIKIKFTTVSKELPLLVITTLIFSVLFFDNTLSRYDAIVLILLFITFCLYLYKLIKSFSELHDEKAKYSKLKAIFITIICLGIIIYASDMVVNSALFIAEELNVSAKLISMVIIVIGTSLPELMITVSSAKKGEFDMSVGNIIGTNIFNICIVLGLPILIFGSVTTLAFNYIDLVVVMASALLFYILGRSNRQISRFEGILMVLLFIVYYTYLFFV